ncbi:uncharacterized protein LOC143527463 [Brachyhypopomus gauderio]|uniref:uncharacterized protein LOC143527463 n=1 Tax=Brachyhypopomus gauderio TaxID=698409 RepID=UPI004042068C
MLGESFIHVLKYRQEETHLTDISRQPSTCPAHTRPTIPQEDVPAPVQPSLTGARQELKQSWSEVPPAVPDLYSNRESHVILRDSQDPGKDLNILSSTYLSKQTTSVLEGQFHAGSLVDSAPRNLRSIPAEEACVADDGYLVTDSSIALNGEPPTNSMLNGYLDRKLREVYSQYLQERLACPGSSPVCSMLPPLSQASLLQLSLQLNLEWSLELGPASQRLSSHFSSPLLRISEQPKYSRKPDNV